MYTKRFFALALLAGPALLLADCSEFFGCQEILLPAQRFLR